ncbi:pentapeptide repeat-containing protein [Streptomyces sp. NPDC006923]|uniref:pentapeptide repeat-containing protein n=1 Tax=Streptomyces sp. NPDC006923 TaxID=3155355 RepID=UPI003404DC9A
MTPNSRPRGGLRLWPVGTVLVLTFITATAVAGMVFFAGWDLLGARSLRPERQLTSSTLFDLVKLAFGVVAGAGALVALVVAYRRQRVDEDGALREATRLHTERFTTAVSQLGEESAAIRLGGVHALAGLADDAPTRALRQTCIDVLCAYLRLPYTAETDLPQNDSAAHHAYLSAREVRHTVIRLIRDHLRPGIGHPDSWHGHDFDFTNAVFDGGDFTHAAFSGGTFNFAGARFSGGVFFTHAKFNGGNLFFTGAEFTNSSPLFVEADFSGGEVDFSGAKFTHCPLFFVNANFRGGSVDFTEAKLSECQLHFNAATFTDGLINFAGAQFDRVTINVDGARFEEGTIDFRTTRGAPPAGLRLPPPTGLLLPAEWT